jgi:hypothetical protein
MNSLAQTNLFGEIREDRRSDRYGKILTVCVNRKGVIDVDTVKGCTLGMLNYPIDGCYGECYAVKNARRCGIDFSESVTRQFSGREHRDTLVRHMLTLPGSWYRVGTAGDPCHDWTHTIAVIRALRWTKKTAVVITKHWITLSDKQIDDLRWVGAVVNTSTSGLDSDAEMSHRVIQIGRMRDGGVKSINRVVTCNYGNSDWARTCLDKQEYLLSLKPVIDNPLRARRSNLRVCSGDIQLSKRSESVGGGKYVSLHDANVYLGKCGACPDQCGVDSEHVATNRHNEVIQMVQPRLFQEKLEFTYFPQVIGSGYENDVSKLALEDGIAHRAARRNMQIHSAIILRVNDDFAGFMTFQNNHEIGEFCLLQSVIRPELHTDELYLKMVQEVLKQNTSNYPAIMTTDPKSKFETPELFESLGFVTYLKMSGFCYMVRGDLSAIRMKLLAHITMTNVWNSVGGEWVKLKKEWNKLINEVGEKHSIQNPTYATRDGCWQGTNGFANVVTGHAHNGNASVLDPVACEVILRFFMPSGGRRIYNPFGGGVQFGFIAGAYGYEYIASEIRQNQCDANNKLCEHFPGVRWERSDSSTYEPEGMFDLAFSCPPYYRVEKYIDYDGTSPAGEINSLDTYEKFREALFSGYRIAIKHLNDGCFFIIMTGDSRDKNGAYYCSEAETELFLKSEGLAVYNKIVYLECEFTRLAQAKKTLNMRKFPKREQKIIVAYKGKVADIKERFRPLGRL